MRKKIPEFCSEGGEFEFWWKGTRTEYLDWLKAKRVEMPNLKRSANRKQPKKS
jgi:hypothetical protein